MTDPQTQVTLTAACKSARPADTLQPAGVRGLTPFLAICPHLSTLRGRQNVASFLVLDLGVDWRRGGDYFENVLLDYDVRLDWWLKRDVNL